MVFTIGVVRKTLDSAQDRVEVNSYQERLTNFGIGWGGLIGDVMLGASFVSLTMVGGFWPVH